MRRYIDPEQHWPQTVYCGANDGGIKRGDSAETGDNEARPTEGAGPEGSGVDEGGGFATADPSSLGADSGGTTSPNVEIDGAEDSLGTSEIDDLTILDKDDPALGLTAVDGVPPQDWAANTGETRVPEGENPVAWEPADPKLSRTRKRR